jgi:hypothetical protein
LTKTASRRAMYIEKTIDLSCDTCSRAGQNSHVCAFCFGDLNVNVNPAGLYRCWRHLIAFLHSTREAMDKNLVDTL